MTVDEKMVFTGLTAWFSDSVSQRKRQDWLEGGGTEAEIDNAQYIFSQSANTPDTQRIFESPAYLDEHLSVFHANFISDCIKKGNLEDVELGNYILPPADVQEVVRREIGVPFIWEDSSHISNRDSVHSDLQDGVPPQPVHTRRKPENRSSPQAGTSGTQSRETRSQSNIGPTDKQRGNQSVSKSISDNQSKTLGEKGIPKGKQSNRSEECRPRVGKTNIPPPSTTITQKETKQGSRSKGTKSPAKHKQTVDNRDQPVNEKKQKLAADAVQTADRKEIWRLENLAKVMDKIDDFSVGRDGYNIYRK